MQIIATLNAALKLEWNACVTGRSVLLEEQQTLGSLSAQWYGSCPQTAEYRYAGFVAISVLGCVGKLNSLWWLPKRACKPGITIEKKC